MFWHILPSDRSASNVSVNDLIFPKPLFREFHDLRKVMQICYHVNKSPHGDTYHITPNREKVVTVKYSRDQHIPKFVQY